jgi:hypothetical protein
MAVLTIETLERRLLFTGTISEQIIVDQFGWRAAAAKKVALFADPVSGQNAAISYTPGATFQVRRTSDDSIALTGSTTPWNSGNADPVSGDKVWAGDFSSLSMPGDYYIYDPSNNLRSYAFSLNANLFNDILKTSTRMFYYQRTGTAIPAQFGGNWVHPMDHVGPNQDTQAKLWNNGGPVAASQPRDVSGGWFDAGDYNKYVAFTTNVIWNLLTAYEWNPGAFADSWNIPESGNAVPDMLDEIKWELDWLRKMQNPDGSVLNRVSNATYAAGSWDPSTDTQARYYTQATTWATAGFAASMAHAARVFAPFDVKYPGYSASLLNAAQNAWSYLQATPAMTPASGTDGGGSGGGAGALASAGADGNSGYDLRVRILAAAELYKTTGSSTYKTYFEANYKNPAGSENGLHPLLGGWPYTDPSAATELNRAYVTYATSAGASPSIVSEIKTSLVHMADDIIVSTYNSAASSDPYRAFMWTGHYNWGSNSVKSEWANLLLYAIKLNVNPANSAKYREVAEEYLHYLHGRNPLSEVYLSNMGAHGANLGADKSVQQVYHSWFGDGSSLYDGAGSTYGPVPGYLVGGPNQAFSVTTISPPAGEPPMKAFKDWNTGWPENSWEITEPAIYYQASYTLLLSQFATDTYAPQALGGSFNYNAAPHAIAIAFNENVAGSLGAGDITIENLSTGTTLANAEFAVSYNAATNTAVLTRTGAGGALFSDGAYRATVHAHLVSDASNNEIAADFTFDFFVLTGDANHDATVDTVDFNLLAASFGKNGKLFSDGDFNYDGTVDTVDFNLLASRFGQSFPAAPARLAAAGAGLTVLSASGRAEFFSEVLDELDVKPIDLL